MITSRHPRGPDFSAREIRIFCIAVLCFASALGVWLFAGAMHGAQTGPPPGCDFGAFYTAGYILNRSASHLLYDVDGSTALYHQLVPQAAGRGALPFAYLPFLALLFRPLAKLPYPAAYAAWLGIGLLLYSAGLHLLLRRCRSIPPEARTTAFLLALSFVPFLMECWIGGQVTAFGFFWIALALYLEAAERPVASGAALAVCVYKPTLLVLILPMLLIGRRYRQIAGFACGAIGLAALSVWAVGTETCLSYFALLQRYAGETTTAQSMLRTWKFVDILAFQRLLPLGIRYAVLPVILTAAAGAIAFLFWSWRTSEPADEDPRTLLWAATLTWTPVLSPYGPIYDTTLAVIGAFLTAGVLYRRADLMQMAGPAWKSGLAVLYLTPWITGMVARTAGFQPYTLVLLAAGAFQLVLALAAQRPPQVSELQPGSGTEIAFAAPRAI